MPAPIRLTFTALEDRTVPAIFGVTWADPQNLSASFAPDGLPPPAAPPPAQIAPPPIEDPGFFWGLSLLDPLRIGW